MESGNFLLPRGDRGSGKVAPRGQDASATAEVSVAGGALASPDGRANEVREWLLLLLRFAITRDPDDELAVLTMANGFDSLGRRCGRSAPTFFCSSSREVCKAITTADDPNREAVLNRHMARIGHARLRRAFQAAVHPGQRAPETNRGKQPDLWTLRAFWSESDVSRTRRA